VNIDNQNFSRSKVSRVVLVLLPRGKNWWRLHEELIWEVPGKSNETLPSAEDKDKKKETYSIRLSVIVFLFVICGIVCWGLTNIVDQCLVNTDNEDFNAMQSVFSILWGRHSFESRTNSRDSMKG
jgi:hypothetical protein